MAKVLMMIAQKGFRDEELNAPKEILKKAGHTIMVASDTRTKATGMLGAEVVPDVSFHEANPDFFDAVIVVGGSGSPELTKKPDVIRVVQAMNAAGKVVAAICLGPMTLAKAGVLTGRKATVYRTPASVELCKSNGVLLQQDHVVTDGNIVTADGPKAAEEFGHAVVALLAGK